jgi:hypothetical protein
VRRADAALVDWVEVAAAPAKGITAIQKAATVVNSPSFVLALADSFSFEINIVASPLMTRA